MHTPPQCILPLSLNLSLRYLLPFWHHKKNENVGSWKSHHWLPFHFWRVFRTCRISASCLANLLCKLLWFTMMECWFVMRVNMSFWISSNWSWIGSRVPSTLDGDFKREWAECWSRKRCCFWYNLNVFRCMFEHKGFVWPWSF